MAMMKVSQKILAQNQNSKKLRHGFVDGKAMNTTTINPPIIWKTLLPFFLQKKTPENAF